MRGRNIFMVQGWDRWIGQVGSYGQIFTWIMAMYEYGGFS